jgi:hypothetical protein
VLYAIPRCARLGWSGPSWRLMGRNEGCVLVTHYVNFVKLCEQIVWVVDYGTPVECSAWSSGLRRGPGSIFLCMLICEYCD